MADTTHTQLTNIAANVRHFLWNDDYIELLAHRLNLQNVRTLVDIGTGLGYLSGLFALYMRAGSTVHGYDHNPDVIRQAQARADARPFSVNFKFEVADAHHLPLEDDKADLAVCQHVLTHLADPAAVLKEMCRIVRPGGRVVAFEPNSIIQSLVLDSVADDYDLETRLRQVRYQYYYEHGKQLLGHGDDSIGDHLPRLFLEAGLKNVEVRLSDKAAALVPPYDTEEKQARAHELLTWLDQYQANRAFIHECFLKGGGSEAEFEEFSRWELEQNERMCDQIRREAFVHPGGIMTYIVVGQK